MVLKSELENDINKLIDDLKTNDYKIPTIKNTASPVFRMLYPLYSLLIGGGLFSWVYHGPHELWSAIVTLAFVVIGSSLITLIIFGLLYYPNTLLLCLSNDVKEKSFLCNKWYHLIKKFSLIVNVICFAVSIPFIAMINWGFIVPIGAYFTMSLIAAAVISAVMSRYLTPEVINIVSNIRKHIKSVSA